MKIAYYTHTFLLDSDLPLIKELQCNGHNVQMFISLPPHELKGSLFCIDKQIQKDDIIPVSEYLEFRNLSSYLDIQNIYFVNRTNSSVLTWACVKLIRKMCQMIEQFNPDVIHITYPLDLWELFLLQFRKKMLLTMHDPLPHSGKKNIRTCLSRFLSIKFAAKIVLLNETQKKEFIRFYHVSEKRVFINRIGSYNYIKNFKSIHHEKDFFNILFFGRISPYKGLEFLCQAMVEVHKICPNATLTIAGGGTIYFDFSPYKQLKYIELRNHYIGMEELVMLLDKAALVVCPYKDATQSGVILTSFGMECPVLASNVGALKEQIKDGESGLLIPPCDVNALSSTIIKLIRNPNILQMMRSNIHEFNTLGENSWNFITQKYISIYESRI